MRVEEGLGHVQRAGSLDETKWPLIIALKCPLGPTPRELVKRSGTETLLVPRSAAVGEDESRNLKCFDEVDSCGARRPGVGTAVPATTPGPSSRQPLAQQA